MLGKYDFNDNDIKKIMKFFEPSLHTIKVLLEETKIDLQKFNLLNDNFLKIYHNFENLVFFDNFLEFKDSFIYFYEYILNTLIIKNKTEIIDRHIVMPNIVQLLEIVLLVDYLIKKSFENVRNNNNVLDIKEIKIIILEKINTYYFQLTELNKNYSQMFCQQIKDLLLFLEKKDDFKIWEQSCELMLALLEDISLLNEKIHDIFEEGSNIYWKVFNYLNKIFILSSFSIFLE
ncbi:hypothetical protein [Spiroplasma taiwanense]|uniref:Uncharacterized protein n=1 Tax=Spiroplasma taiwanense CT-1 TaxID=1276220 RepID=S5LWR5_9MOLU|nr:hypothetical protein [Spiroplasma taiwanense]AGR41081.1 hypothetical protein STAIW_v1c04350 [Spiroplasma taiwanense CT-1]